MKALQPIDVLIILAYLSLVAAVGYVVGRRQRTTAQYFVAGRSLPGWAVAFSIIGTVISSVSFVALPGAAFARDWRLIVPNLTVPLVLVFVTLVIVPFYRRVVKMSSYEYLERRFGIVARMYGSAGFLILRTVDLGFTLLLTAIAVEVITGWNIRMVITGLGVFTILYTLLGGIEAVVWNDVIQGLVLAVGAVTILIRVLTTAPVAASAVITTAWNGSKFSLGNYSASWESLFGSEPTFWMFLASGLAYFGRAYIVEQNIVQRYLVARTDRDAQQATFAGASSCLVIWLTFSFLGSCLWAYYHLTPGLLPAEVAGKPDNIVPYFIATQVPNGLKGLILAAILAAAMQAFSADLTSVATVMTSDYYARFRPATTDSQRLFFGRGAVLAGGLLATTLALQLTESRARAIYESFVILASIVAGGVLGLFALGFLTRRANRRGANAGLVCCVLFVTWATLTGPLKIDLGWNFRMHPLMIGLLSHLILFACGYVASVVFGDPPGPLAGLTIGSGVKRRE